MFSDIRTLHALYPLLPSTEIYSDTSSERYLRAKRVVDIFVHVDLGPMDASETVARHGISCVLERIYTSDLDGARYASVSIDCQEYGMSQDNETGSSVFDIPVHTDKDTAKYTYDTYTGENDVEHLVHGYVVADEAISDGDIGLYVHPDCVVVSQRAPSIYVIKSSTIDRSGEHVGQQEICSIEDLQGLRFTDGNNVSTAVTSSGISIAMSPGSGLGIFDGPPWGGQEIDLNNQAALLSINGLTGDVSIKGSDSVRVKTYSNLSDGVILEIGL